MSPERNWLLLGVVSLGQPLLNLLILQFLGSSPCSVLNHQLFILFIEANGLAVLCLHNPSSNCVLKVGVGGYLLGHLHVLLATLSVKGVLAGSVEEPLLGKHLLLPLNLIHLVTDFHHYFSLKVLSLLANLGDAGGRVVLNDFILLVELLWLPLPINPIRSVIEDLVSRQRLIEVEVSLGNVLSHDRSPNAGEFPQRALLSPISDEGAVAPAEELVV